MTKVDGYKMVVHFGELIPTELQGPLLMAFERAARDRSRLPIEVFKESMADDSKLRSMMTQEERAKL